MQVVNSSEVRWLVAWFRANNEKLASISDGEIAAADYFAKEYIDSFGVITLIAEIEERFNIRFDDLDFQDRRFSTIAGLAEILRAKAAE